jgi:hypothetical protein
MADTTKYVLYHYDPSFVAAVIFIALFLITTFLHTFQLAWKRTWYFIPFLIGGFCKTNSLGLPIHILICFPEQLSQSDTLDEQFQQSNLQTGVQVLI